MQHCPCRAPQTSGLAIEPGITPSTPAPAGVAPLRCTMRSRPPWRSFHAEVMMIFNVQQHARAEVPRDVLVDELVIRRGVLAHQLHRCPVFPAVGGTGDRAIAR